jgi:hypothetical protein
MYVGFRIWYGDGAMLSSNDGAWEELPGTDVQFVTFYEDRTYEIWMVDKWVTENYCVQLHSQDYYWFTHGQPGAGRAEEVPGDIEKGMLKTGSWMLGEDVMAFWDLAIKAQVMRIAP